MSKIKEEYLADQFLVDKVLQGDTSAFATIIKNTEWLVASIVFKMIHNAEERKDIAQDIYLKSFHKLNSFKFQSKLSTWIGHIAFNTCRSHLEKKKMILFDGIQSTASNNVDILKMHYRQIDIFQNETEKDIHDRELSVILRLLIEELPVLYKTLITLYHQEELSYAEIAQITELPEGTVKNYLFRARKALRENLLHKYKNEEL